MCVLEIYHIKKLPFQITLCLNLLGINCLRSDTPQSWSRLIRRWNLFERSAWHLQRAPQNMHSAVVELASRRKVGTQWSVAQERIVFHMTKLLLVQEVKINVTISFLLRNRNSLMGYVVLRSQRRTNSVLATPGKECSTPVRHPIWALAGRTRVFFKNGELLMITKICASVHKQLYDQILRELLRTRI